MESRLIELETKLAFAEDMLDTLNTTVFRQRERIDLLERQQPDALRTLMARAAHLSAEGRERAERDRLLRRAAGISDNETLDRTLREALRHGPGRPDM